MSIVSDLLQWKDSSVLPLAEEDLFDQTVRSPFFPKSGLVLAISSLEPQISVPLLARVLKLPEPEERVAAALRVSRIAISSNLAAKLCETQLAYWVVSEVQSARSLAL
jgi:hypothetical protein